jgi:hypothetical protein
MTRRGLSADRSGKDGWRRLILPMATEWLVLRRVSHERGLKEKSQRERLSGSIGDISQTFRGRQREKLEGWRLERRRCQDKQGFARHLALQASAVQMVLGRQAGTRPDWAIRSWSPPRRVPVSLILCCSLLLQISSLARPIDTDSMQQTLPSSPILPPSFTARQSNRHPAHLDSVPETPTTRTSSLGQPAL